MRVPIFKDPYFIFFLKYAAFYFKYWMLTCIWVCCFLIFNNTKGKEQVGLSFSSNGNFQRKKVPTNLWIWTHILVLERPVIIVEWKHSLVLAGFFLYLFCVCIVVLFPDFCFRNIPHTLGTLHLFTLLF